MVELGGIFSENKCLAMQHRHSLPAGQAQHLCQQLSKAPKIVPIIDSFRVNSVQQGNVTLVVLSTISSNPYLALDCLEKLSSFIANLAKTPVKPENITKKLLETNLALEDCLYSNDPNCRIQKSELFTYTNPLEYLLPKGNSEIFYNNKPWTDENNIYNSAKAKAQVQIQQDTLMQNLNFEIPPIPNILVSRPTQHPFLRQF